MFTIAETLICIMSIVGYIFTMGRASTALDGMGIFILSIIWLVITGGLILIV